VVFFRIICDTISCVIAFIESHSVTVGTITAVVAGSFWLRRYMRQKRAEAFFGFYARLMLQLKNLHKRLEEMGLLELDPPNKGNIYALLYDTVTIQKEIDAFTVPDNTVLNEIKAATSKLKEVLINTESNVYPQNVEKKLWYDSQHKLFEFCEFIEQSSTRQKTNVAKNAIGEYKHVTKCRELIEAMNCIENSIEKAKY